MLDLIPYFTHSLRIAQMVSCLIYKVWHTDHCVPVALSRAREGLFIFGNAANLSSRSRMWHQVIEELETNEALGPALPIACHRHPETLEYVSVPGQLPQIAPDGVYEPLPKLEQSIELRS
jgi:hypothetical protein